MSFKDEDSPENTDKNVNKETDQSKKVGYVPEKKKKEKNCHNSSYSNIYNDIDHSSIAQECLANP